MPPKLCPIREYFSFSQPSTGQRTRVNGWQTEVTDLEQCGADFGEILERRILCLSGDGWRIRVPLDRTDRSRSLVTSRGCFIV